MVDEGSCNSHALTLTAGQFVRSVHHAVAKFDCRQGCLRLVVSLTGSTASGQRVGALAAEGVKRVVLELGGKSASLVLDDADLETRWTLVGRGHAVKATAPPLVCLR